MQALVEDRLTAAAEGQASAQTNVDAGSTVDVRAVVDNRISGEPARFLDSVRVESGGE